MSEKPHAPDSDTSATQLCQMQSPAAAYPDKEGVQPCSQQMVDSQDQLHSDDSPIGQVLPKHAHCPARASPSTKGPAGDFFTGSSPGPAAA